VRFAMENDDGSREWSGEIRADRRGQGRRSVSRWLKAEVGGRSAVAGSNHVDAGHAGGASVNVGH
ncbi:hypothetical protein A2U01_0117354, partial [Trifolium medium]|nr:hypothetical protein [Trifolium medium]